ncbi:MAG: DUF3090 family protein [Actinobacteria bacterium]|nr:DUF3090 family protein [Actinomycetota bacterium]
MRELYEFAFPEHFISGTVGMPGERTFYLQAIHGRQIVSVALEKGQLTILAERILALLKEIRFGKAQDFTRKGRTPIGLSTPFSEEFRVSALSLTWNPQTHELILEAQGGEETEIVEDLTDGPPLLRVTLRIEQALTFAVDSLALINAGRPPCRFCGAPLDPQGHLCPRANGYRR